MSVGDGIALRLGAVLGVAFAAMVGLAPLLSPSPAAGQGDPCTLQWTGTESSAWEDARNWNPQQVPTQDDVACVETTTNLPITVTQADNAVDQIRTTVTADTLRMASGELKVLGTAHLWGLQMAGGTLDLQGDTIIGEDVTNLGNTARVTVTLGGGTLQVGTSLRTQATSRVDGQLTTLDGTTTTVSGPGTITTEDLYLCDLDLGAFIGCGDQTTSTIVGEGGVQIVVEQDIEVEGTANLHGSGAISASNLDVVGTADIDWTLDGDGGQAPDLQIDVQGNDEGPGSLDIADLADVGGPSFAQAGPDRTWDTVELDIDGATLNVEEDVGIIDGPLDLRGSDSGFTSGGRDDSLDGLEAADRLDMTDVDGRVPGDFQADQLRVTRGQLDIEGTFEPIGDQPFQDIRVNGGRVAIGQPLVITPAQDVVLSNDAEVGVTDATIGGHVQVLGSSGEVPGAGDGRFTGDVTFTDAGDNDPELTVAADGGASSEVTGLQVGGTLTVDGTLNVNIGEELPDGYDQIIVGAGERPQGEFDAVTINGDDDATVETEDDGVHLRGPGSGGGGDPGGDCLDSVPNAFEERLKVEGCWKGGPSTFVHQADFVAGAADIARIGGLALLPRSDITLVLDIEDGTLRSDGPVDLETTIPGTLLEGDGTAFAQALDEAWALGTGVVDWTFDQANDLPNPDVLGLPAAAGEQIIQATDTGWDITVEGALPGVLGRATAVVESTIDQGSRAVDRVTGTADAAFGQVADAGTVAVDYVGDRTWAVSTAVVEDVTVAGELVYDAGSNLVNGHLDVVGSAVGGLGTIAADLTYYPNTSSWETPSGVPQAIELIEGGVDGIADTSRVVLSTADVAVTELGLVTLHSLEMNKSAGEWILNGAADTATATAQNFSTTVDSINGVAEDVTLHTSATYGRLADLADFTLTTAQGIRPPGWTEAWDVYEVSTDLTSNGMQTAVEGTLALVDGTLAHLDLPLEIALGGLGQLSAAVRLDPASGNLLLEDADAPGQPATFTCGGEALGATANQRWSGGRPESGPLRLEALCFGPLRLQDPGLVYDDGTKGYSVDAAVGGRPVTGAVETTAGTLDAATFDLPNLALGGLIRIPEVSMELVDTTAGGLQFAPATAPVVGDLLQRFDLTIDDGSLVRGEIGLGDRAPDEDRAPFVANAGDWLQFGGLDLSFDPDEALWNIAGFLEGIDATVDGDLVFDDNGFASGFLDLGDVPLGSLAELDLRLDVAGASTVSIDAEVQGEAFEGRRGATGTMSFDDGTLSSGSVTIGEFPIGDLATIDDLGFAFDDSNGDRWTLGGTVLTPDGATSTVDGSATFTDGVLTAASLELVDFPLGPGVIDRLAFELDRDAGDGARTETYLVTGQVRGPRQTDADGRGDAPLEPITGNATLLDGVLTGFSATIPHLELPGLAYLEDLSLNHLQQQGSAVLSGTGQLITAAQTDSAPQGEEAVGTFTTELADGIPTFARVTGSNLSFGGILTMTSFEALYDVDADASGCAGVDPTPRGTAEWTLSATFADGTDVDGCAGLVDRTLVAAELTMGDVEVGELFTINDLVATFRSNEPIEVDLVGEDGDPAGRTQLTQTTLDLTASITTAGNDPVNVSGLLAFVDGGLSRFELTIPQVPLSATVSLEDIAIAYDGTGRFDGTSDTTFSLSGDAVHGGGNRTSLDGSVTFGADGVVEAIDATVMGLPFGPVEIEEFTFLYQRSGTTTRWALGGILRLPDGREQAIDGDATVTNGRLTAASFSVDSLSVGELVVLSNLEFSFNRRQDGSERWAATAEVPQEGGLDPAEASAELAFLPTGRLDSGALTVDRINWGGLLTVTSLDLAGSRDGQDFTWELAALLAIADGGTSQVTGTLELTDGVVQSGEMFMSDIRIGELATIDTLDLAATRDQGITTWDATLAVTAGNQQTGGTGSLVFATGRVDQGSLTLGDLPLGESAVLTGFTLDYLQGRRWAVNGQVADEDGLSAVGGELRFDDGVLQGGTLEIEDLQLGPLDMATFDLEIDTGQAGGGFAQASTVCGVADPGGDGTRFAVDAQVRIGDGDLVDFGGRLRIDEGTMSEATLCGDNIRIAELAVINIPQLSYSREDTQQGTTTSWSSDVDVVNPQDGSVVSSAEFSFTIRDQQVQTVVLDAPLLKVADVMTLEDFLLDYDRSQDGTFTSLTADLAVAGGAPASFTGSIEMADGVIAGGQLGISDLAFGNLFTLHDLDIIYQGRHNPSPDGLALTENNGCGTQPTPDLPDPGPADGEESIFSVSATIGTGENTFGVGGAMGFRDGKLSNFDITVDCLPIGDLLLLEDVRVKYDEESEFAIIGRMGIDGQDDVLFDGALIFEDGRLAGGNIDLRNIPLGVSQLERVYLQVGQDADGTSTWAAAVEVTGENGNTLGGTGSMTIDDGQIVAGNIDIPELPVIDILTVKDLSFAFDTSEEGRVELAGSGGIGTGDNPATLAASVTFQDGEMVAGSFTANDLLLLGVVPIGQFHLGFDSDNDSWQGSLVTGTEGVNLPVNIVIGVAIQDGRLVSGQIGFDGNGDGLVDGLDSNGNAPLSGSTSMSYFPLKALFIRYCATPDSAVFCEGVPADTWDGRINIELPTDAAPGIDGFLQITNGRFNAAGFQISGLNIPVFSGVFLNSMGAGFRLTPLAFEGTMGITVGPPDPASFARIGAQIGFSEEPPLEAGEDPDDYMAEYLRFYLGADITFLNLPLTGSGFMEVQTRGYLAMGGSVSAILVENLFEAEGYVDGAVFSNSAIEATDPRDGSPLSGIGIQLRGGASGIVLGQELVSADFVLNQLGAAGCAGINVLITDVNVGGGVYFDEGNVVLTCDLGRYVIAEAVPSGEGIFFSAGSGLTAFQQANAATVTHRFDIGTGEPVLGVDVRGDGGIPDVVLIAPDGTQYSGENDKEADPADDDGVIIAAGGTQRIFLITDPLPGEWQVATADGSVAVTEVITSQALPPVDVNGTLTPVGSDFRLDYTLTDLPGQQVHFVEREVLPGGEAEQESPPNVDIPIGTAQRPAGSITFTPSGGDAGGQRQIVAIVLNNGLPRDEVVLDAYTVPDATPASAPQNVAVREVGGGGTVTWDPPADTGGRRITRYKVYSLTGESITVDADERTATLDIPAMAPGNEIAIIVEAWTGMGWGEPGYATFTSTQTTDFAYGRGVGDGEDGLPGSGGGLPGDDLPVEEAPESSPVGERTVDRHAGADRIATSVEVSRATFAPSGGFAQDDRLPADTVFVATAWDYPDALAGGPAAYAAPGPVLLTGETLPGVVAEEIRRLSPDQIVILGGPAAVPVTVEQALAGLAPVVGRQAGANRFETAVAVSQGLHPNGADVVYLARGDDFPDALAGGVPAALQDGPVLLSQTDVVPAVTMAEIERLGPAQVVLLGGEVALSSAVEAEFAQAGLRVERLSGPTRFETAAAIADATFEDADVAFIATGNAFPDALSGVPAAALADAPLLLVADHVPEATAAQLARLGVQRVVILGGPGAVPESVAQALARGS